MYTSLRHHGATWLTGNISRKSPAGTLASESGEPWFDRRHGTSLRSPLVRSNLRRSRTRDGRRLWSAATSSCRLSSTERGRWSGSRPRRLERSRLRPLAMSSTSNDKELDRRRDKQPRRRRSYGRTYLPWTRFDGRRRLRGLQPVGDLRVPLGRRRQALDRSTGESPCSNAGLCTVPGDRPGRRVRRGSVLGAETVSVGTAPSTSPSRNEQTQAALGARPRCSTTSTCS
jgi:hypothetical protein